MPERQAKIKLTADVAGLRERVQEGKELLTTLGDIKVDDKFSKQLAQDIKDNLETARKKAEENIEGITANLRKLQEQGKKTFDDEDIKRQMNKVLFICNIFIRNKKRSAY